jgi:hypothetical protein
MYDNPENLSSFEISAKVSNIGHGPNRDKRCAVLFSYSTEIITKEEWVEKFCVKSCLLK